jgi:hypothetical protein
MPVVHHRLTGNNWPKEVPLFFLEKKGRLKAPKRWLETKLSE